ncbi:MAG: 50S ribosomal protein L11 [Candidatus Thermoplasmatota archaeon]|nr:50S ribosomal protein L11 [Candidatus Thermoplasmatota archaeon]MCL5800130.1 50S ribosomal protein L11 [Candidatus Thermoplasmatota archaeon]
MPQTVNTMVEGGKASAGAPLGPALGPLGLNLGQVIKDINEKTKAFAGMQVPISVIITDPASKKYEIKVGVPPTSALLKKELGIESASGNKKEKIAADASLEVIKKVAASKMTSMLSYDLRGAVMEVLGTCVSMGVNVEGKDPKEVQKLIMSGSIKL